MEAARGHFAVIAAAIATRAENHPATPRVPAFVVTTGRTWMTKKNDVD